MTLHFPNFSWRASARYALLPALTLGALTACSDSTGSGGNEPARIHFVPAPYPEAISPDGKTVVIHDPFSPEGDIYFYDVVSRKLSLVTHVGSNPSDMAHGISNNRVLVADYGDPIQAGVWSQADEWQVIPNDSTPNCDPWIGDAWSVSADASVVVGMFWNGCNTRAFSRSGGVTTLLEQVGTPMTGTSSQYSRATVVSNDGTTIGGYVSKDNLDRYPAIWHADGSGFVIPTGGVFADDCPGEVLSLSADGSVAAGNWCAHDAYIWTQAGGVVDIGVLPGNTEVDGAYPNAVSANGQLIFGTSGNGWFGTPNQAFVWTAAKGMRPLQEVLLQYYTRIPEGYTLMTANGASADGTVVYGTAASPDGMQVTYVATVPLTAYGL